MDKKANMKQAMYEMFGVGAAPAEEGKAVVKAEPKPVQEPEKHAAPAAAPEAPKAPPAQEVKAKPAATYLAPGTVMEGVLRAVGDVEIAGDFKGDITTDGTVILHANIQGNLFVSSLDLFGCKLTGDVVASGTVSVGADSEIYGNITAKELWCAGAIQGDLKVEENARLDSTARVTGNIATASIAVEQGAFIQGSIEVVGAAKK